MLGGTLLIGAIGGYLPVFPGGESNCGAGLGRAQDGECYLLADTAVEGDADVDGDANADSDADADGDGYGEPLLS